jgi:hypothetical protein
MASKNQVAVVNVQDKVMPALFTITSSSATQSVFTATLYPFGYNNTSVTTGFQVPAGSNYQLVDMYITTTPVTDAQTIFYVNGIPQGENLILSTLNANNSARAKITQPLILKPADVFNIQIVTLAAASTTGTYTDILFLHFLQVPADSS